MNENIVLDLTLLMSKRMTDAVRDTVQLIDDPRDRMTVTCAALAATCSEFASSVAKDSPESRRFILLKIYEYLSRTTEAQLLYLETRRRS